jgi:methylmalonyl-CoA/ethylmalonyl-CoA epimerase
MLQSPYRTSMRRQRFTGTRSAPRFPASRTQPDHGVTTVFINLPNTKIELLEPLGEGSPIAKFLEKNPSGGVHHVCYEVDDIIAARDQTGEKRRAGAGQTANRRSARMANRSCFCIRRTFLGTLTELEEA